MTSSIQATPQQPRTGGGQAARAMHEGPGHHHPLRVLVVDDERDVRFLLRRFAETEDDLAIVGEAGDARTAIELAANCRPDVILLDVRMPDLDGIAAIPALRQVAPRARIVMHSASEERRDEALERGADEWVPKVAGWCELRRHLLG